jgi:hypothetical protein
MDRANLQKNSCVAMQLFVKTAGEETWRSLFTSAQAAQIATGKNGETTQTDSWRLQKS